LATLLIPRSQEQPSEPQKSEGNTRAEDLTTTAYPRRVTVGSYRVNLLIPTSMSNADVWLDGRKARIHERTANLITIEIPADSSNHQVKIEKEGRPICVTTVSINENGTTLTPCQD
jgi:hypothetical protein